MFSKLKKWVKDLSWHYDIGIKYTHKEDIKIIKTVKNTKTRTVLIEKYKPIEIVFSFGEFTVG